MAEVVYAAGALRDLERLIDWVLESDPVGAPVVLAPVRSAVSLLEEHPLIGRAVEHGLRELAISRGKTGYVALYRFLPKEDVVLVLSLRHQLEAGFIEQE